MKTIVIYDQLLEQPVKFFVLEGDYTHLDNVYINSANGDEALMDEVQNIVYDEDGRCKITMLDAFPVLDRAVSYAVIVCGFIP